MRRRQVNVLCAPTHGPNPGMSTVDLAFPPIAAAAGLEDVRYWRLWDSSEWKTPPGGSVREEDGRFRDSLTGLSYELARGRHEEFLDADLLVFWGDFQHMAVHLEHTAHVWTHRIGLPLTQEEAYSQVAAFLLLEGADPAVLALSVSFGSTLAFNTAADYETPYGPALESFHRGVASVHHRDTYSAEVARRARRSDESCRGVDAAALLPASQTRGAGTTLGVFIGRSVVNPEDVGVFGRGLSRALALEPRWIPWGQQPGFWPLEGRRRLRLAWPELSRGTLPSSRWREITRASAPTATATRPQEFPSLDSLMEMIADSAVVLTDTYHLALNCWRLGVPAICLVDPPGRTWSVNSGAPGFARDKRVDLYSQMDALPLVVASTRSQLWSRATLQSVVDVLHDGVVTRSATRWMTDQAQLNTEMLVRTLSGLVA